MRTKYNGNGKNKGGRPPKYDPDKFPHMAYVATRTGMCDRSLAEMLEVSLESITKWKREYPEFLLSIKKGKDEFDSGRVESALLENAIGYEYDEVRTEEILNVKDLEYGRDWTEQIKQVIKERDDNTCQNPNCKSQDKKLKGKQADLDIHHVDYNKLNNHPSNLITLCKQCHRACHGKGNSFVKRYADFYTKIVTTKKDVQIVSKKLVPVMKTTVTRKKVQGNTVAQMFWLQNRQPERWKNVKYVEGNIKLNHEGLDELGRKDVEKLWNTFKREVPKDQPTTHAGTS